MLKNCNYDKTKSSEYSNLLTSIVERDSRWPYVCEDGYVDLPDSQKHVLYRNHRISYLRIRGISLHYFPKMKCAPKEDSTIRPLYYLGKYEGTYKMSAHYSFKDPHFFIRFGDILDELSKLEIIAVGKFYPCPSYARSDYNAYAKSDGKGLNVVQVTNHVQFHPSISLHQKADSPV